ncbi:MAG: ribonuclease III [Candidatus Buchananbacteria bacterium]
MDCGLKIFMHDLAKLEKILKVKFNNAKLLTQALVHRSYINEHPDFPLEHNERLEFLGDAVLELAVTEYLYNKYPNPEGELTNWRASLVNANTLADIAKNLELEQFLYLSKGELQDSNSKARRYILANALEAVMGAIYLDKGYKVASSFVKRFILVELPGILEKKLYLDPKSHFQELAQEKIGVTPTYKVLTESGPDHAKTFKVGVFLGSELTASGLGSSKQEAQTEAAKKGLEAKSW